MTGVVFKALAIALAVFVAFVIGIVIFKDVWARVGLGAALVVICIPLLVWAWRVDRKEKARRADLEDI